MANSTLSSITQEWKDLCKDFSEIENLQKSRTAAVGELKNVEVKFKASLDRHLQRVTNFSNDLESLRPSSAKEQEDVAGLKKNAARRKEELRDSSSALPKDSGSYLKLILGRVSVSLQSQDEKYKYKEEYEKFKLAVTIIVLLLSSLGLFLPNRILDVILNFTLVWYYGILTIRESILVANGSRIKGWWRTHHFITTVLAGVLILWHDKDSYQKLFRTQFLLYSCYVSFLQFLQYNYQQGCLYRLRALGERHKMDITVDGFHSWMWKGLKFLLPFLVAGYFWQLWNVYTLVQIVKFSEDVEWQIPVAAVIFFLLFSGNMYTTAIIVHQKISFKKMLFGKSR